MKFLVELKSETPLNFFRSCGYAPEGQDPKTGEFRFARPLRGARYPRFHLYVNAPVGNQTITLSLHLDQKQPSYEGSSAHSGEYEGTLVETEAKRILNAAS